MVTILKGSSDGWWYGETHGRKGWFPSNFVRVIGQGEQEEQTLPTALPLAKQAKGDPELRTWFLQHKTQPAYKSKRLSIIDKSREKKDKNPDKPFELEKDDQVWILFSLFFLLLLS